MRAFYYVLYALAYSSRGQYKTYCESDEIDIEQNKKVVLEQDDRGCVHSKKIYVIPHLSTAQFTTN